MRPEWDQQYNTPLLFDPELQNGVVHEVTSALDAPVLYSISRAAAMDSLGTLRPPDFSEKPISPANGLPASGLIRVRALELAKKRGALRPDFIITTSGEVTAQHPTSGEPITVHYGEIQARALYERGVHKTQGANERRILQQDKTTDTIGEVVAFPGYVRALCEQNVPLCAQIAENNGNVTIFSSVDQVSRISAIEALMQAQDRRPEGADTRDYKRTFLKAQLAGNPMMRYLAAYRSDIANLAQLRLLDPVHTVKTLYLLDHVDHLTSEEQIAHASDVLFSHPKFAPQFAQYAPCLTEDLAWMQDQGIHINHLTAEEIFLAVIKADPHSRDAHVASRYLSMLYDKPPLTNIILKTMIAETAGITDLLNGHYYAIGERAQEKKQLLADMSNHYQISVL